MVCVVLLGTTAVGVLGALQATIRGSSVHRDHTNAHAWLQSATDTLYGAARVDCDNLPGDPGETRVRSAYQTLVRSVGNPANWAAGQIRVVMPVLFWDGDQYQSTCYDNYGINLQLVTLEVTDPAGKIVERVEVVKGA